MLDLKLEEMGNSVILIDPRLVRSDIPNNKSATAT